MLVKVGEVAEWSDAADILVVGYGIAGACGAIEACEAGTSALVLERSSGCTGSSSLASGHFYLGGGTAVQKACGFEDSAAALGDYLIATTESPEFDKIEAFSEGCVQLFDWLEAHGIPFERSYFPTKAVVQPGRECLIWTGNERVWPFNEKARPAPRGHKLAWEGQEGAGGLLMRELAQSAERAGVRTLFNVQVDALVMDGERVVGVGALRFGERRYFRAQRGVLLAGGGFGRNSKMLAHHLPRFEGVNIVGGQYEDGSTISLGMDAGAATAHLDGMLVTSPIYPPEQLLKGILVNAKGQRFVAEDSYHTRTSLAIIEQPKGIAYLIVDASIFAYPEWHKHANQCLVDGFEAIEAMEMRLQMPSGALLQTMSCYNADAALGTDAQFGKQQQWLKPLDEAPWAAFDFSFGRAIFNGFTLGGLRISVDAEVLGSKGGQIPGLYAAGACASMLAHDARNYASGISLAAGAFFGRRAGRRIASE